MKALYLILLISTTLFSAEIDDAQANIDKMRAQFERQKVAQQEEFNDYKSALNKAFKSYKKSLTKYWENPELSSKEKWVSYTKDKKTRSEVDFKHKVLHVETIATSKEKAMKNLQERLAFTLGATTKDVVQKDELQNQVYKLSKKSDTPNSSIDDKPILAPVMFKKKPTKRERELYAKFLLSKIKLTKKKSKVKNTFVYQASIDLPKDITLKRSKVFIKDVKKESARFNIPLPLIFAIMQTESDFNPFAKSHIPAYGLMQIVPRSAGIDSYNFLYKSKRKPSASYLYNSANNIEMGSAYLHILYYKYLKKIKDPQSRLYCAIAAYNTGAGNIAWAFTKTHNMNKAAPIINKMNSKEVYNHLLKHLKYDEPKHYLKRVTTRMSAFKNAYKDI